MVTPTASTLVYKNSLAGSREMQWLDCSVQYQSPVYSQDPTYVWRPFSSSNFRIWDMCFVDISGLQLFIIVTQSGNLYASDVTDTDQFPHVWQAKRNLPKNSQPMFAKGVTTDGQGHLFVRDTTNDCIQMFGTDGKFIKTVVRKGQQGLNNIWRVLWYDKMSSLIVGHSEQESLYTFISVVKITL